MLQYSVGVARFPLPLLICKELRPRLLMQIYFEFMRDVKQNQVAVSEFLGFPNRPFVARNSHWRWGSELLRFPPSMLRTALNCGKMERLFGPRAHLVLKLLELAPAI